MFSRTTRLELTIVAAVLLIIVLYSRPPTSGNADTLTRGIQAMPRDARDSIAASAPAPPMLTEAPVPETAVASPADDGLAAVEKQRRLRRVGVVDATNCQSLNYKDVMYGEVAVRWVWNGEEFVPQKVCIVEEGNGVKSVWGFDANDQIVLSERRQERSPDQ